MGLYGSARTFRHDCDHIAFIVDPLEAELAPVRGGVEVSATIRSHRGCTRTSSLHQRRSVKGAEQNRSKIIELRATSKCKPTRVVSERRLYHDRRRTVP